MSEVTIQMETLKRVQRIMLGELAACHTWVEDHPDADLRNILTRIHLMDSAYVELSARLGVFQYPDIIAEGECMYNAFINGKEVKCNATSASKLLESGRTEKTQRGKRTTGRSNTSRKC